MGGRRCALPPQPPSSFCYHIRTVPLSSLSCLCLFSLGLPAIYSLLLLLQPSLFFPALISSYLLSTIVFAIFPFLSNFNLFKNAMGGRAPPLQLCDHVLISSLPFQLPLCPSSADLPLYFCLASEICLTTPSTTSAPPCIIVRKATTPASFRHSLLSALPCYWPLVRLTLNAKAAINRFRVSLKRVYYNDKLQGAPADLTENLPKQLILKMTRSTKVGESSI